MNYDDLWLQTLKINILSQKSNEQPHKFRTKHFHVARYDLNARMFFIMLACQNRNGLFATTQNLDWRCHKCEILDLILLPVSETIKYMYMVIQLKKR